MATEHFSYRYDNLDAWDSNEIVSALFEGQLFAVGAVSGCLRHIATAGDAAVVGLQRGGRLVYVGAGTSGRIGVQDGAELPPTFDWPDDKLVFAMAGGEGAFLRAVENAEDSIDDGRAVIRENGVNANDVVIGLAASGTTPYTIAALEEATARGAVTIGVANNRGAPLLSACSYPILVETGEEVVAGSTRMKAGTSQKIVLNLLSTLIMIRLGRVYRGMMVHMRATNAKLRRRAEIMVAQITGCSEDRAAEALARCDGRVKTAVLVVRGLDPAAADDLLGRSGGNLRVALEKLAGGR
jgi:N-acetylmuramic acid 6-phosphate etherase